MYLIHFNQLYKGSNAASSDLTRAQDLDHEIPKQTHRYANTRMAFVGNTSTNNTIKGVYYIFTIYGTIKLLFYV